MSDRFGKNLVLSLALLSSIALFCGSGATWAAEGIASFKAVSGTVDVLRGGKLPAAVVKTGDTLSEGDFVRTRSGSFAEIQFKDGTVLKVAQRSRIDIAAYFSGQQKNGANVRLPRGKVEAIVDPARVKEAGKGKRFEVHTPNAVAGVRGTDFIVSHERNLTGVFVRRGSVYTYNRQMPDRMVTVNAGNITTITPGAPPQTPRQALPSETQRLEKGMTAPKSGNGRQSGTQNGSQTGSTATTTGIQTATTATQATQPSESVTSTSGAVSDSLPVLSSNLTTSNGSALSVDTTLQTLQTLQTVQTVQEKTTQPPEAKPVGTTSSTTQTFSTVISSSMNPPPPIQLPTSTNVNINVNFPSTPPPTPPPIPPPPSTNVNIKVNF